MHLRRPCRPPSTPCHRLKASPSNDTPCSPVERRLRGGQTSTPLPPPLLHKEMDLPRYLRRVNLLPVILTLLSFPSPRPIRKKNYTTCNDRLVFYSQNSLQEKFSNISKSDIYTELNITYRSLLAEKRKLVVSTRRVYPYTRFFSRSLRAILRQRYITRLVLLGLNRIPGKARINNVRTTTRFVSDLRISRSKFRVYPHRS